MRTGNHSALSLGSALLVGALLFAMPCAAAAASLRIKPAQLHPYSSKQQGHQDPYVASGGYPLPTPSFWYLLDLPVGTTITGLSYQHSSDTGAPTGVAIIRARPDASPALQNVYLGGSNVTTGTDYEFIDVTCPAVAGAATTVEAGWRYAVGVWTTHGASGVGAITVLY